MCLIVVLTFASAGDDGSSEIRRSGLYLCYYMDILGYLSHLTQLHELRLLSVSTSLAEYLRVRDIQKRVFLFSCKFQLNLLVKSKVCNRPVLQCSPDNEFFYAKYFPCYLSLILISQGILFFSWRESFLFSLNNLVSYLKL